jgi:hypothetical protein
LEDIESVIVNIKQIDQFSNEVYDKMEDSDEEEELEKELERIRVSCLKGDLSSIKEEVLENSMTSQETGKMVEEGLQNKPKKKVTFNSVLTSPVDNPFMQFQKNDTKDTRNEGNLFGGEVKKAEKKETGENPFARFQNNSRGLFGGKESKKEDSKDLDSFQSIFFNTKEKEDLRRKKRTDSGKMKEEGVAREQYLA